MRALLIGMDWFPDVADGGLNRYFYESVYALPRAGVCGDALVSALSPGQNAPLTLHGMAPSGASILSRWRGARRVTRSVLREGVNVVNSHFALYTYPILRTLPSNVPLVVHFHGPFAAETAAEVTGLRGRLRCRFARHIEHAVYQRASRVITLSEAFKEIACQQYGVPSERVRVIPGGLVLEPYLAAPPRLEARERLGWPADRPVLLSVRRLARRMGLEGLIEAMTTVRRAHPNALLLIGGKGALYEELQTQVQRLALSDHVKLLGFISDADLPTAYAAADLTVVPTVALEGFGLVTVESLAAGTPVLGTPVGGTPEILRDLNPQLIFEASTPDAIAERLIAALDGRISLPNHEACRAYADRYAWSQVAPRIASVFKEAITSAIQPPLAP